MASHQRTRRGGAKAALIATCTLLLTGLAHAEDGAASNLVDLSLEQLMQVEVTTTSKIAESAYEAPGVVTVVSAEEIRRFGARTVEAVLNRVTSMYLFSSYMFPKNRMSLRGDLAGHYDNHVLILINGRPFRDSMLGGMNSNFYQAFPVAAIERVEVVRGPGSTLYGSNAFVGVINVITRKGAEQTAAATVGGGSFKTIYTDASYGFETEAGRFKASVAGGYHNDKGFEYAAYDETIGPLLSNFEVDHQGSKRGAGYVNLTYADFVVDAFLSYGTNDMLGVLPIWPMQEMEQPHRHFVDAGWEDSFFGDKFTTRVNVTYNFSQWQFVVDDPGPVSPLVETKSHNLLGEVSGTYTPIEAVNVTVGVISDYKKGYQEAIGEPTPDIPPFSELWWSGYLQADYEPIDRLKIIGGFQWHKPDGESVQFVPRAGLIVDVTDHIGVKGLYGQAYRAPLPGETDLDAGAVLQGNPDLEAERAETWDAEVFYHDDRLQVSTAYYHTKEKDLIVRFNPGTGTQFFNLGELKMQGMELDWKYAVTESWYLRGSYAYQWNRDEAGTTDATLVSSHMFKIGASYDSPRGFLIGAFYSMLSEPGQLPVAQVNPKPETWHLLDVNLELDLNTLFGVDIPFDPLIKARGQNLANVEMDFPEWVRRNLNSLPQGGGAAGFADLTLRF